MHESKGGEMGNVEMFRQVRRPALQRTTGICRHTQGTVPPIR